MASRKPASALDAALAESPPTENQGRRSLLDREDVHDAMREWMRRRAEGERVGSATWFATEVIRKRLKIPTGVSNVKRYMQTKFPDEWREAVR